MKMNKRFIGLLAGMALFGSCHVNAVLAEPMPNEQLNQLAEEAVAKKPYAVGYPVNQNLMLRDFYDWFIKTGLCNVCMNNVGDPFHTVRYIHALSDLRKRLPSRVLRTIGPLLPFFRQIMFLHP